MVRAVADACARDPWLSEHPATVDWVGGQFASGRLPSAHPLLDEVRDGGRRHRSESPRAGGGAMGKRSAALHRHRRHSVVALRPRRRSLRPCSPGAGADQRRARRRPISGGSRRAPLRCSSRGLRRPRSRGERGWHGAGSHATGGRRNAAMELTQSPRIRRSASTHQWRGTCFPSASRSSAHRLIEPATVPAMLPPHKFEDR